jgi:hypothetical protein
MKKISLFIVLIIATTSVIAQTPAFTLGPKIGATFSKYHYELVGIDESSVSNVHWGAFFRLGSKVYLQPELLFMKRSGILKYTQGDQTIDLRTIDIPLLVGVKVADLRLTNIRAFAGPVASLTVNREIQIREWDDAITEDDFRRANWGLQFGAGVDLLMLTVDLRYELGMSDYIDITNHSLKNNLVTLSIGWKIL